MQIQNMKVSKIHPYEKNPRINDQAVDAVAKSIQEFGWRAPIVVDKDFVIVCGHTRWKAAKKLGLEEVPVHIAADLTPEQVQAYRIADNKTAEIAEWDFDILPGELQELKDADFDLDLLGFDPGELEALLNGGADDTVAAGETDPDEVPEVPEEAASVPGTVYQLGQHRLLCGDATKPDDVAKVLGEEKVDLYVVDPPYNVNYAGNTGLTIENDNMVDDKFRDFLDSAFSCASAVLKPGASFYIFHSDSESINFRLAAKGNDLEVHETLYWIKNNFVLGRFDYHYKSESCLYGWKPGAAHNWYSDRCQSNLLNFDRPKCNDVHPTMKPVEMLVYLIRNSSRRGETVLDTFAGSGSTAIACEQTGRICRMIELDPKYCDVIRRRWAEFRYGEGCDWQEKTPALTE